MNFIAEDVEAGTASKMFTPDFFEESEERIRALPEGAQEEYANYQYFCENVIRELRRR